MWAKRIGGDGPSIPLTDLMGWAIIILRLDFRVLVI